MWSERRWLPLVLGVSLLTNIFLVGLVTGRFISDKPGPGKVAPRPVGWFQTNRLAPEEKKGFTAVMRAHREDMETNRRALRDAKAALEAIIAAPVYDRAGVETAFAAVRRASDSSQRANQTALAEAMGTLGATARANLIPPAAPSVR